MTRIRLTAKQARRMGLNLERSVPSPEPPQRRRATTHTTPPPSLPPGAAGDDTGAIVGLFGTTLHKWLWAKRVDGYISVCGRIQRNNRPQGTEGVMRCEGCFSAEEVQGDS